MNVQLTHLVLYSKDLPRSRYFYLDLLGCGERRYAREEGFLSLAVGNFILNFYAASKAPPLGTSYAQGIAHLGFELAGRAEVEHCFGKLLAAGIPCFGSRQAPLRSAFDLAKRQTPGPFRFYVPDPDGYRVEVNSWQGHKGS